MKKVALSLAGVLAAAAFAPEASALPAFARQTGMACTACHFQKFPVLNGFGRAFKASGYTLMGAQGKVEGEHLSIPDTLNAALLLKYRYAKDSGPVATPGAGQTAATAPVDGQWQMGDEYSLFFGGRIADSDMIKIGFLNETNMAVGSVAGLRVPVVVAAGPVEVSVVPFTTDALGVQYGYELGSAGQMRANRGFEMRRETSAIQYMNDRGADGGMAAGHAFVVKNDMFFVNYTIWSSSFAPGANGQGVPSTNYGQKYIRAAVTPSIAGFDFLAGFGQMSGESYGNLTGVQSESKMTFIDVQAQGEVAGMEAMFTLQNAKAPVCTGAGAAASAATTALVAAAGGVAGTNSCVYNPVSFNAAGVVSATAGSTQRSATTVTGEITVIPHALTVGLGYRTAKTGGSTASNGDNATTVTAVYDLFQNVAVHLSYTKYSGSAHTAVGTQQSRFLGMLEAAW